MNKKAQGLSINVIIIVAIALIVLVVLIAIFTGRLGGFVGGLEDTANCEAACTAFGMDKTSTSFENKDACTGRNRYVPGTFKDVSAGVCCCKYGND